MTDIYLRNNYERIEEVGNFPKSIVNALDKLDRETWLSLPKLGSHKSFMNQPPREDRLEYDTKKGLPLTKIHLPKVNQGVEDDFDVVRISTEASPFLGQTFARIPVHMSNYGPGGKFYRRLSVLYLLNKEKHPSNIKKRVCSHMSLPVFSYSDNDRSYLLQTPAIYPEDSPSFQRHVCTLKEFLQARPDWWMALPKEEKKHSVLNWMTCLASTVSFFHSLKMAHGEITTSKIYIVKTKKDAHVVLQGWHQAVLDRPAEDKKKRGPLMRASKSFGMIPETPVDTGPLLPLPNSKVILRDQTASEASRAHDVKMLGEIFGDLLLVLLGLSRDGLARQRRERSEWMRDQRNKGQWDADFYPRPPGMALDTSSSSMSSDLVDVKMPTVPPTPNPGSETSSSKPNTVAPSTTTTNVKTDSKKPGKSAMKERPSSGIFGMFGKKNTSPNSSVPQIVEPPVAPKPQASKRLSYGVGHKSMSSFPSATTPTQSGWWLEELKLMYPQYTPDHESAKLPSIWTKHTNVVGNQFLPLLTAMTLSDSLNRARADAVWKEITRIVSVFFDKVSLCCSANDESICEVKGFLKTTILAEIAQRGIPDEEDEAWEGLGWEGPEQKGPKTIGRRGEGMVGECLF